ncbi:Na/Pi cotransporter family protein [Alkalibacter rhizosphaerae]|uniref:Na/Pi cotransporter family protein n=1 Tax=Alkalibacter rhizosphaerae TaxID=2815577 RepID=A0A974XLL0_9FIRM|nr:Na/Pi cotransporter family protein [Alkalibacter rhizosphaerae]QSX08206.1 Na/Pi cotransporter family protein [Alkalibacter rhizosphaerae]
MTTEMIFSLVGGLGLFIYGMNVMSDGLKAVAGDRVKRLLEILTNNRFLAILVGTVVTVIVQSSSTTTVMVVGFVNAGIMNLFQAAGVILGANVGTTITAQMVALKVDHFAPIFIGIGMLMMLTAKKKKTKQLATVILGFGILFLGISLMSDALKPLRGNQVFVDTLISFGNNPVLGLLAGLGITAIIQSSSATIGLLQAIALSGTFNAVDGISTLAIIVPILLGMNIGTCVTALISSIGANTNARKAALIHLVVNIAGSIWVMILLLIVDFVSKGNNPIYYFIQDISGYTMIEGVRVHDVTKEIANTHTLFNVANTLILYPFMNPIVRFIDRLIPDKTELDEKGPHLDKRLLGNPAVAMGQVVKEITRMGRLANKNLHSSIEAILHKDEALVEKVFRREKLINDFAKEITQFLVLLSNEQTADLRQGRVMDLFSCVHDIERIGDHAENLAELAQYRIDNKVSFSDLAVDDLKIMMDLVEKVCYDVIEGFEQEDSKAALSTIKIEDEIDAMEEKLRTSHIARLNEGVCNAPSGIIFLDVISNLERVGDHATNIAEYILN